jgi:hypothetical protein
MSKYGGLLGAIAEASDIKQELGVSADEAFEIQRQRAAERLAEMTEPASNVVYGVDFRKGRADELA